MKKFQLVIVYALVAIVALLILHEMKNRAYMAGFIAGVEYSTEFHNSFDYPRDYYVYDYDYSYGTPAFLKLPVEKEPRYLNPNGPVF